MIKKVEDYLRQYLSFPDERYFLPLALFAVLMHCWDECFDEVPYLSVSAVVKGVGKTRVLELLQFLGGDDKVAMEDGSITMAALYTRIEQHKVVFIDEAERFNNSMSPFRPILNGGYRRGQTVTRKIGGQIEEFSNFCPKGFVTIGDLYDSLRDRCIVVLMTRAASAKRKDYVRKEAKADGNALAVALSQLVKEEQENIAENYARYHDRYPTLDFLPERDQELWKPLFTLCQVFAPGRIGELERSAVDISTLKTLPIRRLNDLKDEDGKADEARYAEKLIHDAILVMGDRDRMATSELIRSLRALNTAPWRSYRGTGLSEDTGGMMLLSGLLSRFGIESKTIRVKPKSEPQSTAKGFYRADLLAGAERAGVTLAPQKTSNPVTLIGESAAGCNSCATTAALAQPDCGGCGDLHRGIIEMAKAHPAWDDQRLAEACGTNLTTVRAARTRFRIPGNRGVN